LYLLISLASNSLQHKLKQNLKMPNPPKGKEDTKQAKPDTKQNGGCGSSGSCGGGSCGGKKK